MKNLEVWYAHTEITALAERVSDEIGRTGRRNLKRSIARARRRDSLHAFSRLTHEAGGSAASSRTSRSSCRSTEFEEEAREDLSGRLSRILRSYQRSLQHDRRVLLDQFRLVDVARKVVGVGSVGTDAWIALFVGRDDDDPLILQIKEAQPSVLEEFAGPERPPQRRGAGRGRPAHHPGDERHLPGLDAREADDRRRQPRLLRPPAPRLEGIGRGRGHAAARDGGLRPGVRCDARPRARALGRPRRDRGLPRVRRRLRPGDRCASARPTPSRTSATTRRWSRP